MSDNEKAINKLIRVLVLLFLLACALGVWVLMRMGIL